MTNDECDCIADLGISPATTTSSSDCEQAVAECINIAAILQKLICDGEWPNYCYPLFSVYYFHLKAKEQTYSAFCPDRSAAARGGGDRDSAGAGHPVAGGRRRRRLLRARQGAPLAGQRPGHRKVLRRAQRRKVRLEI